MLNNLGSQNLLRVTCLTSAILALGCVNQAFAQAPAAAEASDENKLLLHATTVYEDRETGIFTAEGDVEVRVGERVMRADRVIYDRQNQTLRAQGNVQIRGADGSFQFADEIQVDEEFQNGFATRFSSRMDKDIVLTASAAVRSDGNKNSLEQVVYTGCPLCEDTEGTPTWSIRSRRAVQNQETQMISYQDAVLEIKGIPVIYIPYFAHPDPTTERRSGLLPPDLGASSKRGIFYEQPYLWSISENSDLTITPQINANVNPLLKLNYRKRFFSGFVNLDGSFTQEQDFNSDGDRFGDDTLRSHLYGSGRFNINQDWAWGFGIERQTDDLYDQRYDIDGEDDLRGLYASQPRQLLTQLFTTGQAEDYYVEAALLSFQGLRSSDVEAQIPQVTPMLFAEKLYDLKDNGQIATNFSAVALFRDEPEILPSGVSNLDSARATISADWGTQKIVGPGLVVEPFSMVRGDYYRVDDGSASGADDITRALGLAGATISYPLFRSGENVDILVEPIAMVSYGTESANDPRIANQDSLLFEADDSNIFRPNAIANYDLWEGGARSAIGLSARADFNNDMSITGVIGRRWRESSDPAFNELSNLSKDKSDYVASVSTEFGRNFQAGARVRFDDELTFNRIDANLRGEFWRLRTNARYFRVAENAGGDQDEGIAWNGALRMNKNWSAIIRQNRNLTADRDIRLSLGVAYQDDCSYFALTYERSGSIDRTLGPSDSIKFEFVLTGLGGVSGSEFD